MLVSRDVKLQAKEVLRDNMVRGIEFENAVDEDSVLGERIALDEVTTQETVTQEISEHGRSDDRPVIEQSVDNVSVRTPRPTYEETFFDSVMNLHSKRKRRPPEKCCVAIDEMSVDFEEPCNWNVAMESSFARQWRETAQSEFESLQKMKTWYLVPLPDGKNIVGSKWVFKVKRNYDNTISRFKARLVAQSYSQERGLDYEEVLLLWRSIQQFAYC